MPRDPGPPRGVLRTPTLGEGLREHERVAPRSAALAEHIAHFWWVRWELSAASVVETLPHPCVHLTVEARRAECAPYVAQTPGVAREVSEGLLLWLAFQL